MDTQGHPRTPKDTSKCTHSHSTHAITTISHKNNFTHSHTHAHTCTTPTPSMHPTHSNNSIQTHKHHSASSFHFISIQPIPSITKLKNSTTNNIPPSLLISTFTLSKHHFTPILIYFIHHINTKKYLQFVYSNSTQSQRYNTIHNQNTLSKRYQPLFSIPSYTILPFLTHNQFILFYTLQSYIHYKDPFALLPFFTQETQFIYTHFAIFHSNFTHLYKHQYTLSYNSKHFITIPSHSTIHSNTFKTIPHTNSSHTTSSYSNSIPFYIHYTIHSTHSYLFISSIQTLSNIQSLNTSNSTLSTTSRSHSIQELRELR